MDTEAPMTRKQFLKLISTFAFGFLIAKVATFVPKLSRGEAMAYGGNSYGGKV